MTEQTITRMTEEEFSQKKCKLRPPMTALNEAVVRARLVAGLKQADVARQFDLYPAAVSAKVKAFIKAVPWELMPEAAFETRAKFLRVTRPESTIKAAHSVLVLGRSQTDVANEMGILPSTVSTAVNRFINAEINKESQLTSMSEQEFEDRKSKLTLKLSTRTLAMAHEVLVNGKSSAEVARAFDITRQGVSRNLYAFVRQSAEHHQ